MFTFFAWCRCIKCWWDMGNVFMYCTVLLRNTWSIVLYHQCPCQIVQRQQTAESFLYCLPNISQYVDQIERKHAQINSPRVPETSRQVLKWWELPLSKCLLSQLPNSGGSKLLVPVMDESDFPFHSIITTYQIMLWAYMLLSLSTSLAGVVDTPALQK